MSHRPVPAYNEDSHYYAPVFFTVVAVIGVLLLFDPWGWREAEPGVLRPPESAKCWEPSRWSEREFCSEIYGEGRHGYVNPGSMEWEVE